MSGADVVGVLGGTFNPVHFGHIELAARMRSRLELDRVLLVPSARPPHKSATGVIPADHRLRMLRAAVEGVDGFAVSALELQRPGPSFTLDTLRAIRFGRPPCLPVFLMGDDALRDLPTWRSWRSILREFDLAVARRRGAGDAAGEVHAEIARRVVELDRSGGEPPSPPLGAGGRVFRLELELPAISSREVRERAARGESLAELVPPPVARYIRDHRFYVEEAPS